MSKLILDLDVGNSTTKWRLSGSKTDRCHNQDIEQLQNLIGMEPDRIRVACVADDALRMKLAGVLQQSFNQEPEFAQPASFCAGLRNGYDKPEMLGIDRWLAGLAAWVQENKGPCLVIDAGSALTIDTVDDDGVFRGGYIVPGLVTMQQSLVSSMGKIMCGVENRFHESFREIPANTACAVHWGACFAITAIVEKAIEVFLLRWPHGTVRMTGGNGFDIAGALGKEDAYRPDLVLDGLALVLP